MKKYIIYITIIIVSSIRLDAQESVKLQKSIDELREAMINPNKENLESIVMEQLTYGHSGGNIDNKKEFVEKFLDGRSDFVDISLKDQTIEIYKKTAIVRHNLTGKTMDKGKAPGDVNIWVMTTWVKDGKKWKLLARQAVKKV
jgi:hypothetical protein